MNNPHIILTPPNSLPKLNIPTLLKKVRNKTPLSNPRLKSMIKMLKTSFWSRKNKSFFKKTKNEAKAWTKSPISLKTSLKNKILSHQTFPTL